MPETSPRLTVDCAAFDPSGRVLLIRRGRPPFEGAFALPGGFVAAGETVEEACRREFREETGLDAGDLTLVGVYSEPGRDPRGPVVSIAFATRIPPQQPEGGDDAAQAMWIDDWRTRTLAFDHAQILSDAARLAGL